MRLARHSFVFYRSMFQISECLQHMFVCTCVCLCAKLHTPLLHFAMASTPARPGLDLVSCLCGVFAAYNIKQYSFVPPSYSLLSCRNA